MKKILIAVGCFFLLNSFTFSDNYVSNHSVTKNGEENARKLYSNQHFKNLMDMTFNIVRKIHDTKSADLLKRHSHRLLTDKDLSILVSNLGFEVVSELDNYFMEIVNLSKLTLVTFPRLANKATGQILFKKALILYLKENFSSLSKNKSVTPDCDEEYANAISACDSWYWACVGGPNNPQMCSNIWALCLEDAWFDYLNCNPS